MSRKTCSLRIFMKLCLLFGKIIIIFFFIYERYYNIYYRSRPRVHHRDKK